MLRSFLRARFPEGAGCIWLLVWFLLKPAFPPRAAHPVRRPEGGKDRCGALRSATMSGVGQFKSAVPERSDPEGLARRS